MVRSGSGGWSLCGLGVCSPGSGRGIVAVIIGGAFDIGVTLEQQQGQVPWIPDVFGVGWWFGHWGFGCLGFVGHGHGPTVGFRVVLEIKVILISICYYPFNFYNFWEINKFFLPKKKKKLIVDGNDTMKDK